MSRLFVTGDTHRHLDMEKFSPVNFPIEDSLTSEDVVWILGDSALCFFGNAMDTRIQDWWEGRPYTVISTIGNHDNWDLIERLPIVEKYGGRLYEVRPNLFYADDGVFTINGKTILNVNGADSQDKVRRQTHRDWWSQEQITEERIGRLQDAILLTPQIDYVFSHTGGVNVCSTLGFTPTVSDRRLTALLDNCSYGRHFCGHYHVDTVIDNSTKVLYNTIVELY